MASQVLLPPKHQRNTVGGTVDSSSVHAYTTFLKLPVAVETLAPLHCLAAHCGSIVRMQQYIVLAAVTLYNTGLWHHAMAMVHGCMAIHLLRRALDMYTRATTLLSSSLHPLDHDKIFAADDVSFLLLALLNNTAHIHANFMDLERAWQCLSVMREEFDVLDDEAMSDEDFGFFGLFLMLAPDASCLASPADVASKERAHLQCPECSRWGLTPRRGHACIDATSNGTVLKR
ncbi:expressed unknown protein [Seminavis robusta]|uniref:Uncharacterized protein n=1 Tax=Seminavis robusta TaxID=568900 RepID=A0A9N8H0J7_9STRA|nr:expressed unknown protein [Seminavis robusta]|eukprot:Sro21_g015031.1  (231) ;mRNA; f:174273-174965